MQGHQEPNGNTHRIISGRTGKWPGNSIIAVACHAGVPKERSRLIGSLSAGKDNVMQGTLPAASQDERQGRGRGSLLGRARLTDGNVGGESHDALKLTETTGSSCGT